MYTVLSTRNRPRSNQKLINGPQQVSKFFKKSSTDQNQKNMINYLQKIGSHKKLQAQRQISSNNLNLGHYTLINSSTKKPQKHKRSMGNITAGKSINSAWERTAPTASCVEKESKESKESRKEKEQREYKDYKEYKDYQKEHKEQKEHKVFKENKDPKDVYKDSKKLSKLMKKDKSSTTLKINNSVELPKLIAKSISQTTINRKMDENKLKMLEKVGFRRKIEKNK